MLTLERKKAIPTFLQCTHLIPGVRESLGLKLQVGGNKNQTCTSGEGLGQFGLLGSSFDGGVFGQSIGEGHKKQEC